MSDIAYSEKLKILRRTFKEFNKENGFKFVKPTLILRVKNDILQYITFHFGYNDITPEIVAQPLYYRAEDYCPEISTQLNFLDPRSPEIDSKVVSHMILSKKFSEADIKKYTALEICERFPWGDCNGDISEFTKDMEEILSIISQKGFTWFEHFESPQKIINTVNEGISLYTAQGFSITSQKEIQALSYWYLGDIDNGIEALKEAQSTVDPRSGWIETYQQWIDFVQQNPEKLSFEFEKKISQMKDKLKLSK